MIKPVAKGLGLASVLAIPVLGQITALCLVSKLSTPKKPDPKPLQPNQWGDEL